jgi:hypothetical protein
MESKKCYFGWKEKSVILDGKKKCCVSNPQNGIATPSQRSDSNETICRTKLIGPSLIIKKLTFVQQSGEQMEKKQMM